MTEHTSSESAEISVAVIPVDKFGHDAGGDHRPLMCACSFRRGGHSVRWLSLPTGPLDFLRHVAKEAADLMGSRQPRVVYISNGFCLDELGMMTVKGDFVDPTTIAAFRSFLGKQLALKRSLEMSAVPDILDVVRAV